MTRVVLASASPRRRELLACVLEEFEVVASNIEEPLSADGVATARDLARAKASDVAAAAPDAIVIGADTVVFDDARTYGKPADTADGEWMLRELRGRRHQVVTGVAVWAHGEVTVGHTVSEVEIASLDDRAVSDYVATGRTLDKAGGYAIQDEVRPVARLVGCYCNVVGLPLWQLRRMLAGTGAELWAPDRMPEVCRACPDRDAGGE